MMVPYRESARYEGENAAIQNENVALAAMIAGESAAADAAKRELAAAVGERAARNLRWI